MKKKVQFSTQVAKFRDRKTSRNVIYIGNEIFRAEALSRSNIRSPYDSNIIINPELLVSEDFNKYLFITITKIITIIIIMIVIS